MVGIGTIMYQQGCDLKISGAVAGYGVLMGVFPWSARLAHRVIDKVLLGALLYLGLGLAAREKPADLRRMGLQPPARKGQAAAKAASPPKLCAGWTSGDLVLCNHTSFIEVLWLAHRLSPEFAILDYIPAVEESPAQVTVRTGGVLAALWHAVRLPIVPTPKKGGMSLQEASKKAQSKRKPLVVFPEVARSNGDAVLLFGPGLLEGLSKQSNGNSREENGLDMTLVPRSHLLGFSYPLGSFSLAHPVGSTFSKVLKTCYQLRTEMTVVHVSSKDVPGFPGRTNSPNAGTKSVIKTPAAWVKTIRELMAQCASRPLVSLSVADYASFWEYWSLLKKDKKAAAKLADLRSKKLA